MTIDLTQNILDTEGEIAKLEYTKTVEENGEKIKKTEFKEVTLGSIIGDCVLYEVQDHSKMTEEEHLMRYDIYERVRNKEQVELSDEEIKFIKSLIVTGCMPHWAVQAIRMLNK